MLGFLLRWIHCELRLAEVHGLGIEVSYWLTGLPLRWDFQSNTIRISTSKFNRIRWLIGLFLFSVYRILHVAALIHDTRRGTLHLSTIADGVRPVKDIAWVMSFCLTVHVIRNYEQMAILTNASINYLESCTLGNSQWGKVRQRMEGKAAALELLVLLCFYTVVFASPFWFLLYCKIHFIHPIYPVCSPTPAPTLILGFLPNYHHDSIPIYLALAALNIVITIFIITSFIIYFIVTIQVVVYGTDVWSLVRTQRSWIHDYRCFQLLAAEFNKWMGKSALTYLVVGCMVLNIAVICFSILLDLPMIVQAMFILVQILVLIVYWAAMGKGGAMAELTADLLNHADKTRFSTFENKAVDALPIIQFIVWKIPMSKALMLEILDITINTSIDTILTLKSK